MYYRPRDGHGLPHNPFNAIVTPRPIGWISTRCPDGRNNLAPYSFFNAVAYVPPQVMYASTSSKQDRRHGKDSSDNALETGQFCVNIVELAMKDVMNMTSGPYDADTDEFQLAGIQPADCNEIDCFRVAAAPASLECRLLKGVDLAGDSNRIIIGEVIGVHLRDDCLVDGRFEVKEFKPLARLGYHDYSWVEETFSMMRPTEST